ncbi:enoyl-ACP reductase FabI [Pseudobacteriovorax antillogorgiicola]|uniref:Enoyl-[acyl-carrier-protein] reductase [NADH] n=1 Tax=Pseudobacteriovorax antillogorgiicola TaxID=1513793 RepID=A0A1Y6CHR2_9BACT|nr:enoyl-ACP reductase [Pseudobacteriovorax antillogorgiicola]TCS48591.1 enoyl-[acyl-carrier-protein] reductase [NADH] [Pseudobacteriovorax antillogorgiicola]SMF55642.1 Enoyl-[acyl-carrier-protein] reductase [NADH] [Pseudobacteriovorax antillogorgiicola]
MGLLEGKRGIIMGIANDRSIASSIAKVLHSEGAKLGFSYLPDTGERERNKQRLLQVTDGLDPQVVCPCDVTKDDDIKAFFQDVKEKMGTIDFLIHSIAFAPTADLKLNTIECSREGFANAMDVSVYSFLATSRAAADLMVDGGSICAMTYYGGEKVMPGYNLMGLCKSALDTSVKYAAYELGSRNIRVNAISAGPIKTLAASAVGDFKSMLGMYESVSPLGRNVDGGDVGHGTTFLVSDLSRMITGEIMHIDAGFNIMGGTVLKS